MGLFDNLRESIGRLVDTRRTVFDPTLLGDPLALKVEWAPMASGGTNFRTHALRAVSPHRTELRPTIRAWAFCGLFAGIGTGACLFAIRLGLQDGHFAGRALYLFLFGIPFLGIGLWSLRRTTVRQVFDTREGYWWTGSVSPAEDPALLQQNKAAPLSEIHAVQLVTKSVSPRNRDSFMNTEINLVFHDGSRRHLVDHGSNSILDDAQRLASFLGVPLWSEQSARRPFDPTRDQSFAQAVGDRFAGRQPRPRDPSNQTPA